MSRRAGEKRPPARLVTEQKSWKREDHRKLNCLQQEGVDRCRGRSIVRRPMDPVDAVALSSSGQWRSHIMIAPLVRCITSKLLRSAAPMRGEYALEEDAARAISGRRV